MNYQNKLLKSLTKKGEELCIEEGLLETAILETESIGAGSMLKRKQQ